MRFTNKNISRKAAAITVATSLTVFGGAGAAIAYWTTTGSGSGSASVGSDTPVVLSAPAISGLAPGSTAQTVNVSAANSSDTLEAVNAVSVVMSAGSLTDADLKTLGVTATVADNSAQAAPHASTVVGTVTVSIANSATVNQDQLKNLTINLAFTSN